MIKRYLQKWLGIEEAHNRITNAIYQMWEIDEAVQNLKLTKANKPQNCKPPVRKAAKKRGAK